MDELSRYDYPLPEELIADRPASCREDARLLVVDRRMRGLTHRTVRDLPELLNPGDCLILNDTRVLPARLFGRRTATGGAWEGLYLGTTGSGTWRLMSRTRGKLRPGESVTVVPADHPESDEALTLTLQEAEGDGIWTAQPDRGEDVLSLLERFGSVPLPPYIRRPATDADREWYQTTFARRPGAVAAPTAGLHLTPPLLARCREAGVQVGYVTLHVGVGTFRPVNTEKLSEHTMHAEWCEVPVETMRLLRETRQQGDRVVAVGTTTVRTLESAARDDDFPFLAGPLPEKPWQAETDLFIRPPFEFRAVDCLLTNFHLPRSTLLVLVSAFAGIDLIQDAYACAVRERYRFYSYGDAMLIV